MNRDRLRNRSSRKSKRVILVACEGKNKTERNYLSNYCGRDKDYVIKMVPGNETDPINLVNKTIKLIKELSLDLENDDRAFVVFDADVNPQKNKQMSEAILLVEENNIITIISSPCIELWFYLHYDYTMARMNNATVIKNLKKYCQKYEKNYDIYPDIKDKLSDAIKRSKKLEKFHLQNNNKINNVETNPYTGMYKLIEELIK